MKRLLAKLLDRFAFWAFGDDDDLVAKIQDAAREEDPMRYCTRSMAAALCVHDLRTPLTATWAYSADDPLAVTVSFSTGQTWRFARDLLRDGALTGAGEGDVVVTPVKHGVEILFRSGTQARVLFSNADLIDFIDAAEQVVPWGQEQVDHDALVRQVTA